MPTFDAKLASLSNLQKKIKQAKQSKDWRAQVDATSKVDALLKSFSEKENELYGAALFASVIATPVTNVEDFEEDAYSPADNQTMRKLYQLVGSKHVPSATEVREHLHCSTATAERLATMFPQYRQKLEDCAAVEVMSALLSTKTAKVAGNREE